MASALKNLSDYDINSVPDAKGLSFAVVIAEWNENITKALATGCVNTLIKHGVSEDDIVIEYVPGAFELTLGAQLIHEKVDAVICIGCVIKGDTKHDEYINNAVAQGLTHLSIKHNKPFIFGVLTPNTEQQAIDRSGGIHGNKGDEAAITAIKMISTEIKSFED
jgi:6,7-dimethyl-8-ribityllumazine synthase